MKTFFAKSIFLCILGLVVFVAIRRVGTSLNGAEIHRKCDVLWRKKKFDQLYAYIDALRKDHNDYLPARLAYIQSLEQFGGCFEDMVQEQVKLRAEMEECFPLVSPVFLEIYEAWMVRTENASRFYLDGGVSRERRLKQMDPRYEPNFHFPQQWGIESLFSTVPPLLLLRRELVECQNVDLKFDEMTESDAKNALVRECVSGKGGLLEVKRVARSLVMARFKKGGLAEVAATLVRGDALYTFDIGAEILIKGKSDSIPIILARMRTTTFMSDIEPYLWLLARIGILSSEVRKEIEACIDTFKGKDDLRSTHIVDYARRVLNYLEGLNRNSSETAQ